MAMPMTEEEKQRLLAQAARGASSQTGGGFRQAGMSSGMMSNEDMAALQAQTASMKGKENKVKSQRAYANSLRGKGAPQGKEVGPYGVYMGPNWGESLAHAGGEVLGGYLSGKADRADEALDEDRSDVALAKATEAKERQMYEDQLAVDAGAQQQANFEAQQAAAAERELSRQKQAAAEAKATAKYRAESMQLDREKIEAASATEAAKIAAKQKEHKDKLPDALQEKKDSSNARVSGIEKGAKLLRAFNSGAQSGSGRELADLAGVVTGTWTDQGRFDEELNSYAEQAARAALKDAGEVRPTDADVEGMKASMFGIGRDESTNINLLTEHIQKSIAEENEWREAAGEELMAVPNTSAVGEDEDWYETIFKKKEEDLKDKYGI